MTNQESIAILTQKQRRELVHALLEQFVTQPAALTRILETVISREGLTAALKDLGA